jgi:hypothetical protein
MFTFLGEVSFECIDLCRQLKTKATEYGVIYPHLSCNFNGEIIKINFLERDITTEYINLNSFFNRYSRIDTNIYNLYSFALSYYRAFIKKNTS